MKKSKKRNKIFVIVISIFLFLFFVNFIFRAFQYKDNYLIKYDAKYWENRYLESQWVVPNSTNSIGDDGLYAYAGYKYVFEGLNPIYNSAEVPPLGKYLIGYTILIFNNQNIFGLLTGIISLAILYIFNLAIFRKKVIAFIPVFIFSFDKLFWEQLQANYLDLLYLSFLCLAFLFTQRRKYFFASIALGCFAATKFPPISIFVALTMLIYVFIHVRRDLLKLFISFVLWPTVFVITYLQFFLQGNNFIDFLKVLKYFVNYYASGAKSQNNLMVFEMLFLGRWPTWWTGTIKVEEWNLLWPMSAIVSAGAVKYWRMIVKEPILITLIWIIVYTLFLLLVPVAPRYLLLLIPFLYNVAVWILLQSTKLRYLQRFS